MAQLTEVTLEEAVDILCTRAVDLNRAVQKGGDLAALNNMLDLANLADDICYTVRRILDDEIIAEVARMNSHVEEQDEQ